ncbi:septum formation initiator family protein [Candidatus Daviesbacteria bacterium]|nr:septum formation initiator family protein [Candidatus Daviesbacteria bacterium]
MLRKITVILGILILSLVLIGLIRQIGEALNSSRRFDSAIEELSKLQKENKRLQKRLTEVKTEKYIEEIARNKLNMTKPDETIVIVPNAAISKVLAENTVPIEPKLSSWQGWLKLFVH